MTSTPDRRLIIKLVDEACTAGARRWRACKEIGLSERTLRRWATDEEACLDRRTCAKRSAPQNKLSEEERARILTVCHEPKHASLPPSQIVPRLADEGEYIASESSFYRVLRQAGEQHHRGAARAPQKRSQPKSHCARRPNEVWSWDITWLAGPARGLFFHLYLIIDIFSRKIVGWEVYEQETSEHAAAVVRRAILAAGCIGNPLVLHADNGSPMKGATLRATLEALGVTASYSRPRVSNDNPFSESVFRTCKYRPDFPSGGFSSMDEARAWVYRFVRWYNEIHRHSGIGFVTPNERHSGNDSAIMAQRRLVYEAAKRRNPERWSREIRNWKAAEEVWLNPEKASPSTSHTEGIAA